MSPDTNFKSVVFVSFYFHCNQISKDCGKSSTKQETKTHFSVLNKELCRYSHLRYLLCFGHLKKCLGK